MTLATVLAVVFALLAAFCAFKWMLWRIQTFAFVSYIVRNGFKEPTKEDISNNVKFVIEHMVNDLFRRK